MDDIKLPSTVIIGELSRIVKEFEEKIQNGAKDVMRNTYDLDINDDTICMVTNYIGKAVFEEDCR